MILASLLCTVMSQEVPPDIQRLGNFQGPPEADGLFGISLAAGDIDGDGFNEVVVGAPEYAPKRHAYRMGRVYVFRGPRFQLQHTLYKNHPPGAPAFSDHYGIDIAVEDLNGDGFSEVIVQYSWWLRGDVAEVWWGPDLKITTELESPAATLTRSLQSFAVADFEGDGSTELAVSIPTLEGVGIYANLPWDREPREVVNPEPSQTGNYAVVVGDFNADASPDLAIGYDLAEINGEHRAGKVWVVWGPDFEEKKELFHPISIEQLTRFGVRLDSGDVNGDQIEDLLVATWGRKCQGKARNLCSECFVFLGPDLNEYVHLAPPLYDDAYASFGDNGVFLQGHDPVQLAIAGNGAFEEGVSAGAFFLVDDDRQDTAWPRYPDPTPQHGAKFGREILSADLTGDGIDDIVVGAPFAGNLGDHLAKNGEAWLYDFSTDRSWVRYGENYPRGSRLSISGVGEVRQGETVQIVVEALRDSRLAVLLCAEFPDSITLGSRPGPPYLLVDPAAWVFVAEVSSEEREAVFDFKLPDDLIQRGTRTYVQAFVDNPNHDLGFGHTQGLIATLQPPQ